MADEIVELAGVPVLVCDADGPSIATDQDAVDVIGATYAGAEIVAVPAGRLDERFFTLRTGVAGGIMQKFVNYRVRLVIVGDIAAYTAGSTALRDLVTESNRGKQIWFVDDLDALAARLT
ncbi:DUF4180 domain-containing protein [Micromonospora sp. NBC_01813]|uniref:DUF4180 domain-containing protein n=1 Tax=Micromonospora sp. NBC_01813 TaxID=2975988 RepID=UPI002DD8EDC3|nr:DUF4180 domain-containing protein [Micromonospora sp. NBC_01813]WSA07208.1 DUF4180 domain-containing protein [Micromonospora sp. NBC_01813]